MNPLLQSIDKSRLPVHIAIIMDGNGRWAKSRGSQRAEGHVAGVESVRKAIEAASQAGVKYLTLYAFSTENWNRPKAEVEMLWQLIISVLQAETPGLIKNNVCLRMIGDIDRLPQQSRQSLQECIDATSRCTGLQVNLALSYSGRWEITEATRRIAQDVRDGRLDASDINEHTISQYLTTASVPDPDMLIRTGGDIRVSNFLLWQTAYSELYFTSIYWPEFNESSLYQAIIDYQSRERRFGKTSEQVNNK